MRVTKPVNLVLLERELAAASVAVAGLGSSGFPADDPEAQDLFTYDERGLPTDLPPEAAPVVAAHDAATPQRSAAFEAAEDAERLRLVAGRARTDPAFAALADLALGKERP